LHYRKYALALEPVLRESPLMWYDKVMSKIAPDNGYTPSSVLTKQGVSAVGGIAGGLILMVIDALPRFLSVGAGALIGLAGISALFSKDKTDRKAGLIATAAGALTVFSRVGLLEARPLAGTLLSIGAVGLLALGIWNGLKFLRGLKARR
jgi:hypothetical protein